MTKIYYINPEDQTPYQAAFVAAETEREAVMIYLDFLPKEDRARLLDSYTHALEHGDGILEIECLGQVCAIEANLRMEKWS